MALSMSNAVNMPLLLMLGEFFSGDFEMMAFLLLLLCGCLPTVCMRLILDFKLKFHVAV